ncbi:MAG: hypothetical protein IT449_08245 [Phycisphaerales bacterium]|nr:hypothetical protein [Phycisphaerales bacterium]
MTQWLSENFSTRAAEDLAHWLFTSLWQGTAAALATALLIRFALRRCRPALKGALWVVVLVKFVVPAGPALDYSAATLLATLHPALSAESPSKGATGGGPVTLTLVPLNPTASAGASIPPVAAAGFSRQSMLSVLVALYIALLIWICAARACAYARVVRQCRRLPRAERRTEQLVAGVCRRLGARRVRDVRVSEVYPAPFILGLFRPVLVLSTRQLDDACELEAVVLHEVAHLRRGDLWVRWLQWLAGTLLFFWPVVAWVNRRLDLIRELACDEWALRHGRLSNGQYARCLLNAVSPVPVRQGVWRPVAMASNVSTVERRIEMIMQQCPRRGGWVSTAAACTALAIWSFFVLGGAKADSSKAEEVKPVPQEEEIVVEGTPIEVVLEGFELNDEDGEWIEGAEGEFEFDIVLDGELDGNFVPMPGMPHGEGQAHARLMIQGGSGGGAGPHHVMAFASAGGFPIVPPDFIEQAPAADVDGDGKISREEYTAYHIAIALKDPQAVLAKYPAADRNKDGVLDAIEAARLIARPPMPPMMFHGLAAPGEPGAAIAVAGRPIRIAMKKQNENSETGEVQVEVNVEGGNEEVQVETTPEGGQIVRRRIIQADGKEEVTVEHTGPGEAADSKFVAFQEHKPLESTADWMRQTIVFQPKTRDVKPHIGELEQAMAVAFLERHPEADADGDGKVSLDERKVAEEKARKSSLTRMKEMHAKMLEQHPDWDANKDGELSKEEVRAGTNRVHAEAEAKAEKVEVIKEAPKP